MTKSKIKPMIRIHDATTGEIVDREMTDLEIAQYEKDQLERAAVQLEAKAKEAQRQAILDRLGLTADEAQLLLG
jgi:hypothetical protein